MSDLLRPTEPADADVTPEAPIDPGDFVVAMAAENQMQAQILADALEDAGIPAILQSPRSGVVGTIASPVDGFSILVPRTQLARALPFLEERRAALDADPDGAARAAEEEELAGEKA